MSHRGYFPTKAELTSTGSAQEQLHERAALARRERFGDEVFVRAVVEISNYCRENCEYCGMRRDNRALRRFRANRDQIAELLIHHRPQSITDVNIQAGEDPVAVREVVLPLIETLRRETALGISVCLGTLTPETYGQLQAAGAGIYIMKFESASPAHYARLQAPASHGKRLEHIRLLASHHWVVSSGFIVGLPSESTEDLIAGLQLADSLPIKGCSVSPFIPGEETPLSAAPMASSDSAFNCMAAMRLMRPDWVIPAVSALNLAEHHGYRRGLRAGANLVTMNLTPDGLRSDYVIYKRDRFIMTEERVLSAIAAEGLTASKLSLQDYYRNASRTRVAETAEALT